MLHAKPLIFASLLLASASVVAQAPAYAGPSDSGRYAGPSGAQPITIKQLLAQGRDGQYATVAGKIARHLGGSHYMLTDATGELQADISTKHFPAGVTIDEKTAVEVTGKIEKKHLGATELDVKSLRIVTH